MYSTSDPPPHSAGVLVGDISGGVLSQEDIDNHNKERGCWVIIHGRVYDVGSLSVQVEALNV